MSVLAGPWMSSLPRYSITLVMPEPESSSRWPPRLSLKPSSGTAMPRPPSQRLASSTATRLPSFARSAAAVRPAAPAPMIATSTFERGASGIVRDPQLLERARREDRAPLERRVGIGEAQVREALDGRGEREAHLQAGELRPDARVDALAEGDVRVGRAGDVHAVR